MTEEFGERLTMSISEEDKRLARMAASREDMTMSELGRKAINKYVRERVPQVYIQIVKNDLPDDFEGDILDLFDEANIDLFDLLQQLEDSEEIDFDGALGPDDSGEEADSEGNPTAETTA